MLTRAILFTLLLSSFASAQSTTGQIAGVVSDATGATVPRASVAVTNAATGIAQRVQTNDQGVYRFAFLSPGNYHVRAEKQGFRSVSQSNVRLQVDQVAQLDFRLEVGATAETLTVEAAAPLLEQSTSALGQVIDNSKIANIPLNGRSSFRLVQLTPGVLNAPSANGQFGDMPVNTMDESIISINGGRNKTNEIMIDGVPSTTGFVNVMTTIPSVDATEEFKVQSSNLSAEWGRFGGGVINVSTKSGTNRLHGSLFEFLRNSALDSNEFFNKRAGRSIPPFRMNQYGFALGGPVRLGKLYDGRNRTFFFADLQGTKWRKGDIFIASLPTSQQVTGDFSQTLTAANQRILIYDPLTTRDNPAAAGRFVRDAFPGNLIPAARLNPVTRRMLTYFPKPNTPGNPFTFANNFVNNAPRKVDQANYSSRGDHNVSQAHRLFGRFSVMRSTIFQPDSFGNAATSGTGANGNLTLYNYTGALDNTVTLNPTTIVTLRYGFARFHWGRPTRSFGFNQTELGLPASLVNQFQFPLFPTVNIEGFASMAGSSVLFTGQDTHSLLGSLTKIVGKHSFKTGFDGRLRRNNRNSVTGGGGRYNFTRAFTQGPDPNQVTATAGSGMASFLLGAAQTGDANVGAAVALQNFYYAGYLQDDIRLSSKLTLNLGLRYEIETPYTERYNQINYFDFGLPSPVRATQFPNLTGGLAFADASNRTTFRADRNNLAPRFGFAYSALPKTVLRGGLGVFYSPLEVSGSDTGFSPSDGYSSTTVFLGTLDGVRPFRDLSNPFPEGLTKPVGSRDGAATFIGQSPNVWMNSPTTPIVFQWNLDVQRELPGAFLLDIAYTASHGSHLTQNRDFNALDPALLSLGTGLQTLFDNPFASQVAAGPLAQPRVARRQLLLPRPQFGSVFVINDTSGNSTYHAMNVKLERRYRTGAGFLLAYTWAKLISDVRNGLSTLDNGQNAGLNPGVQNWYDLRSERSISELDVAHTLTASYVAELPVGKGKRFLNGVRGPVGKLVEGWQFSGVTTWRSGFPLNFSAPITGGGNRPNSTGRSANLDDRGSRGQALTRWFDTTAFTVPAAFTFGNVGRNLTDVRGPSQFNWDLSLAKTTVLRERLRLQFRAESFNVMNRPNFFLPVTNVVNVQFGQINTSNGNPRINQLALKLIF